MLRNYWHKVLFVFFLSGNVQLLAQTAMPDRVCVGVTRRYWVVGSPGSVYTWKINGVVQSSTNDFLDINWTISGTFNLEVLEHLKRCTGDPQTGTVTVVDSPALEDHSAIEACGSYSLPAISGKNLSGNEAYYDDSQAAGGKRITGPVTVSQKVWIYDETSTLPNCSAETSFDVLIVQPLQLTATVRSIPVSCFGAGDGRIALSGAAGGSGSYEYSIDGKNWSVTPGFDGLTAGSYPLEMRDIHAKTCTVKLATPEIAEPAALTGLVASSNITCSGNDGSISISHSDGGSGSYEFSLDNKSWTSNTVFTGLSPGSYTIYLRDALVASCRISLAAVQIRDRTPLSAGYTINQVSCTGKNNGTISAISPSGGSGNYEYSVDGLHWQLASSFGDLKPASYNLQLRDANSKTCVADIQTIILKEPDRLSATVSHTNETFSIAKDGTIAVTNPLGGSGVYRYSLDGINWYPQGLFTNLNPGTYDVYLMDAQAADCFLKAGTAEIQTDVRLLAEVRTTNPDCYGMNDGRIVLVPLPGASGNFQFSIDGGHTWQSGLDFPGLYAGNYTLRLRDSGTPGQSTAIGSYNISQPGQLIASVTLDAPVAVAGGTARVTVRAQGGTGSYSGTGSFDVPAGPHSFTVTDSNNCVSDPVSLEVVVPRIQEVKATVLNPVKCYGGMADLEITVAGGTAPYNYSLSGGNLSYQQDGSKFRVRASATPYQVNVVDQLGMTGSTSAIWIYEPSALFLKTSSTSPGCYGEAEGTASVQVTGGSEPHRYLWNDPLKQTNPVATRLKAGSWSVVVTDANGCSESAVVKIEEQGSRLIASVKLTPVRCWGGADGTATAVISGGSPPYRYRWNNSLQQANVPATGLKAGRYRMDVDDSLGCSVFVDFTVSEPAESLKASVSSADVKCYGGNDGTATVLPSGGTPPYACLWNDRLAQTTGQATGLKAGTYRVHITDVRGCTESVTVTIGQPAENLVVGVNSVAVNCYGGNDGTATAIPSGGTKSYTCQWNDAALQKTSVASGLKAGVYRVTATDANGCKASAEVKVTEPEAELMAKVTGTGPACFMGNDGSATVSATGGTGLYRFVWSDSLRQTSATAVNLKAGNYRVTVTDVRSCSTAATITLSQPATAIAAHAASTPVKCFGGNDGSAAVNPSGGAGSYTYLWNDPATHSGSSVNGLTAGSYTVLITDLNRCTATATVTVTEPPTLLTAAISGSPPKCAGEGTGSATVSAEGGVTPYNYVWNDSKHLNAPVLSGLAAGTCQVLVTDAAGCSVTKSLNLSQPDSVKIYETVGEVDYKLQNNGTINLAVTGGTGTYSYKWNTGATTRDIDRLRSGTYQVAVTDQNGCERSKLITIPFPNQPPVALPDNFSAGCDGVKGMLISNDADQEGDPFFIDTVPVKRPLHGTLILNQDGSFDYHAAPGFSGMDGFNYAIYDTRHYLGDTASVSILVFTDFDCDGIPDQSDVDADADGILLAGEGGISLDSDGDGFPNYLDLDSDHDGLPDQIESQSHDNYRTPLGLDSDRDGLDDAYDPDQGGFSISPVDTDGDGTADFRDTDSDGDRVPDYIEAHDADADGKPDKLLTGNDQDGDGLDDAWDTGKRVHSIRIKLARINAFIPDYDGDGIPDWRDANDDNDEYLTRFEDLNMDGDFSNDDTDFDGHPEYLDYGRDCDLLIPEAFSPNDDNIHDYFQIYCIDHYPNAKLYVFDRSGKKVYEKDHYGNLFEWGTADRAWWNGKAQGRPEAREVFKVPPGTYQYVLKLGNGDVRKSFVFVSY